MNTIKSILLNSLYALAVVSVLGTCMLCIFAVVVSLVYLFVWCWPVGIVVACLLFGTAAHYMPDSLPFDD